MTRNSSPHHKCRACDFWTTKADDYCPNCGIKNPGNLIKPNLRENLLIASFWAWTFSAKNVFISLYFTLGLFGICSLLTMLLIELLIGFINLFGLGIYIPGGLLFLVGSAIATISLVGFDIYKLIKYLKVRGYSFYSMFSNEKLINERISEISQWERKSTDFLNEFIHDDNLDPTHGRQILDTLKKAMISRRSQKHQYIVKRREIELIRWQNQLAPLVQNSRSIENLEQCSSCLKNISQLQKEGDEILNKWAAETPVKERLKKDKFKSIEENCPEAKEISDKLNESLATCEKIRQDLLAKKAAFLAQQASPLEAPKIEASFKQTAHLESIDVFNILPDLGAFSAGFDELEREYFRLKAECDLN